MGYSSVVLPQAKETKDLELFGTIVDPQNPDFGLAIPLIGTIEKDKVTYRYASGQNIGQVYTPPAQGVEIGKKQLDLIVGAQSLALGNAIAVTDTALPIQNYPAQGQGVTITITTDGTSPFIEIVVRSVVGTSGPIRTPSGTEIPALSIANYVKSSLHSQPLPVGTVFSLGTRQEAQSVTFRKLTDAEVQELSQVRQQGRNWADISKNYTASEIDEPGGYYGFLGMDGKWFIKKVTPTDVRFAAGKNGIAEPWKDRASKNYKRFSEVDWNGF